jgi:hypothetical protein
MAESRVETLTTTAGIIGRIVAKGKQKIRVSGVGVRGAGVGGRGTGGGVREQGSGVGGQGTVVRE